MAVDEDTGLQKVWELQPLLWGGTLRFAPVGGQSCSLPVGCRLWASSVALCGVLQHEPALARGRALELGAGSGLLGVFAASAGCKEVVLSDCDDSVLSLLRGNIKRNASYVAEVSVEHLDFCDEAAVASFASKEIGTGLGLFDLIVAAECVYERGASFGLMSSIRALLAPGGAALLANRDRPLTQGLSIREQLREDAEKCGLRVQQLDAGALYFAAGLAASGLIKDMLAGCVDDFAFFAIVSWAHETMPSLESTRSICRLDEMD